MTGDEIRYGIIGTGMMGVEHISNLLAIDGVRVTAIADPDERSLDWAHNSVGIDATIARFGDHHQLIDSGECDAVVIASPNHTHRAILDDVLDSSLHVMVEKPLCTTIGRLPRRGRPGGSRSARPRRVDGAGVPLHAADAAAAGRGARRHGRRRAHGGDPRAPLPVPPQGRRLEPLQPQHRRHAGREVLPLLRPDEPGHRHQAAAGLLPRAARTSTTSTSATTARCPTSSTTPT